MTFNENLDQGTAKWVLEEIVPMAGHRIDHHTLSRWRDAHNRVFVEQVGVPGCSCEYVQTMKVWQSRISQYDTQLKAIAYPPVVIEPSEIIEEAVTEIQTLPNEIRVKTKKKVAK